MLTAEERTVLHRGYPVSKVNRADADRFSALLRGSVRLVRGLYRTEDEQEAFINAVLPFGFPECATDDGMRLRISNVLRLLHTKFS
jgi:uncharacterized protein YfaP (DUF2135 family)